MDLEELILQEISEPSIPDREFLITEFGAIADGKSDCTDAFEKAIDTLTDIGGGKIVVPAGEYLTGPIHIKSNIELHLETGARIKFIQDPHKYLPVVLTRFEGMELYNYSPFIYAYDQQNIAVTGSGELDGQSDNQHWWFWKGKEEFGWQDGLPEQSSDVKRLSQMARDQVPVEKRIFGAGHYLRPNFIQFYRCSNVLIDGIKIVDSPMWCIHPVMCTNVIIRNVRIESQGPNNDGINPESCTYVLIENCHLDTGDDSIAIKSGKNEDGRRINMPSQYILIRNNVVHSKHSHGGVVIGSEMSGGVKNVLAYQNVFINLERVLRIKTNTVRGGFVDNIFFKNNVAVNISHEAIVVDSLYDGETGSNPPIVRNIYVEEFKCINAKYGLLIKASGECKIGNIVMENSHISSVNTPLWVENAEQVFIRKCSFNNLCIEELVIRGSLKLL
ncbi:MAG TPA: glycoside hydrolase family 28 protein [Pseudothermotoga sp.]|nr:glycoside hydrolase family 28 protein [Pseudothermotoga sp.]HOK84561.1 glycoside hydrolase family 28 protein [Pseudothermotoga sp.]HPP69431.1 glycoside hydrolase family 28 protein [Pseudothermotoga sp.]